MTTDPSREPSNKPYRLMTDDELRTAMDDWNDRCEKASGWSSAYFSAKQTKAIEAEGKRRGLSLENKFQIKVG